jgi:hypothetical protein
VGEERDTITKIESRLRSIINDHDQLAKDQERRLDELDSEHWW